MVERALQAELTDHLGYDAHAVEGRGSGNSRNGSGTKTLQTEQGPVPIEMRRDRNGTFEPQLVKKHQRRFDGFDDKILGMYARGMSVRDIQAQLSELYGTEVSPHLIDVGRGEQLLDRLEGPARGARGRARRARGNSLALKRALLARVRPRAQAPAQASVDTSSFNTVRSSSRLLVPVSSVSRR